MHYIILYFLIRVVSYKCGLLRWCSGKESTCQCRRCKRRRLEFWVRKIHWRRKWKPNPVFLPGKFHGQRNLAGYAPSSCRDSDMIEHAHNKL